MRTLSGCWRGYSLARCVMVSVTCNAVWGRIITDLVLFIYLNTLFLIVLHCILIPFLLYSSFSFARRN